MTWLDRLAAAAMLGSAAALLLALLAIGAIHFHEHIPAGW